MEVTMALSKVRETAWKKVPQMVALRAETKAEETRWEPGFRQS
jgi:hypothetical protein